jgi:hypothetical protein
MNLCDIHDATHVLYKGTMHRIASKWGIGADGRLAKPSEGGFGCITDAGERIDMWQAERYYFEPPEKPFMSMWTVYFNPSDFPGKYVARRFDIFRNKTISGEHSLPSIEHFVADSLQEIRERIPFGMVCLMRSEGDDANIVETWV